MAVLKAFRALRPTPEYASKVAALPYDVMNSDEARRMVFGNPYSFLHVDKAEIDLPKSVDIYDDRVYEKARENLSKLVSAEVMKQDEKPCLYIYEQTWRGRTQTGIVGCTAIDDYINDVIKKHEKTRADKEADRIRHVDTLDANTGPIFLTYRKNNEISSAVEDVKEKSEPVYDFVSDDVRERVWVVSDNDTIDFIIAQFKNIPSLYIADGHHRAASAVKVGLRRREQNPNYTGDEEFNFFLSVIFPSDELRILDYNRVIKDLNGLSDEEFLLELRRKFDIEKHGKNEYRPKRAHSFGMYMSGEWYALFAKSEITESLDAVKSLDVSILQDNVISPILGIDDPRTDKRIDFVGGIRGLSELSRRVDSGEEKLAFSMFPTTLDELMNIADKSMTMPPKSTWFEPKLLSGLFIHYLK